MQKDSAAKHFFFFFAVTAYSQLFCKLLGIFVSELNDADINRQVFFDYNFQWMNLAGQSEFCMAVYSHTVEHISQRRVAMHLRCGGIFHNHFTANLLLNQPLKEF